MDFASYIVEQLRKIDPTAVVWHFEYPTQWERWLADRLVEAGGERSEFDTPLSPTPGIRVRTPWSRSGEVEAVLRALGRDAVAARRPCPALRLVSTTKALSHPLHLAPGPADGADPPAWLVATWDKVRYRDWTLDTDLPTGTYVELEPGDAARLHALSRYGQYRLFELPSGSPRVEAIPLEAPPRGLDCAARIGSHWWVVDPMAGTLFTTDPEGGWVPKARWAGIARGPDGELVLASADQWVAVFDPSTRREVRRFPAIVSPSVRATPRECSALLAGRDWYGTFNNMTSLLSVYDITGRWVGSRRLDEVLKLTFHGITALAAEGQYVAAGVAGPNTVSTLALGLSECGGEAGHAAQAAPP